MMIKEASLREDPDLRGELAFLARGCDFVLPSRFKKRLKSFQQAQVSRQSCVVSLVCSLTKNAVANSHMPGKTNYSQANTNLFINRTVEGGEAGQEYSVQVLRTGAFGTGGGCGFEPQLLCSILGAWRPALVTLKFPCISTAPFGFDWQAVQ